MPSSMPASARASAAFQACDSATIIVWERTHSRYPPRVVPRMTERIKVMTRTLPWIFEFRFRKGFMLLLLVAEHHLRCQDAFGIDLPNNVRPGTGPGHGDQLGDGRVVAG